MPQFGAEDLEDSERVAGPRSALEAGRSCVSIRGVTSNQSADLARKWRQAGKSSWEVPSTLRVCPPSQTVWENLPWGSIMAFWLVPDPDPGKLTTGLTITRRKDTPARKGVGTRNLQRWQGSLVPELASSS